MDRNDYSNMSNSELKILIETLINEFSAKKDKILRICEDLEKIQIKLKNANNELSSRKNVF